MKTLNNNSWTTLMGLLLLMSSIQIMTGCTKTDTEIDDSGIIGRWSLIETLADPGDGSGVFQKTDLEKILEFRPDGLVESETPFCTVNNGETGVTYTAPYDDNEKTISPDCRSGFAITYELTGKDELTMYFPWCIEPCGEKYVRLGVGGEQ